MGDISWDGDLWEEAGGWRIDTSWQFICWVVFALDITSVDSAFASTSEVVDSLKNFIGGPVSALAFPPSLNNPTVVAIDLEVGFCGICCEECLDE
jgi:hypothetical protein